MQIVKMGVILMIVTLVAAAALSGVNKKTKPIIDNLKKQKEIQALYEVLPETRQGVLVAVKEGEKVLYHKGFSGQDTTDLVGYACKAEGKGFSSTIQTIVGVDRLGTIKNIVILDQKETPGLGTKIKENAVYGGRNIPWYAQFRGKKAGGLAVDKDGGQIAAVTGATISSRATTEAVRVSVQNLKKQLGGFKAPVPPDSAQADSTTEGK